MGGQLRNVVQLGALGDCGGRGRLPADECIDLAFFRHDGKVGDLAIHMMQFDLLRLLDIAEDRVVDRANPR